MNNGTYRPAENGATLIVTLIFLMLMAMFAITAYKASTGNLRVVGNMQIRQEAIAVAQKALEETISTTLFTKDPATVAATPITVDIDGNGTADYTARLNPQPVCFRTKNIKSSQLDATKASDLACIKSAKVDQGGFDLPDATASAGDSLCANSEWNIGAAVTDAATGTSVTVNQGVAVRVLATDAANFCP